MNLRSTIHARVFSGCMRRHSKIISGVALILHDATEARQKNFEAIESERVQALTLLAASVAHEIGNPLNALHIHLQLMERELKKLKSPEQKNVRGADTARPSNNFSKFPKAKSRGLDYIITQFLQAIRPAPLQLKLASLNGVVEKTFELLRGRKLKIAALP